MYHSLKQKFVTIRRDQSGVAAIEFALLAPVMMTVLLGALDFGHTLYVDSILSGEIERAGRDSSLEGAGLIDQQNAIDLRIEDAVHLIAPAATVDTDHRFYKTFSEAASALAEQWTDTDLDGVCNNGEPYVDTNLNDRWDDDGGNEGQGGAKDVVIITSIVTYNRITPLSNLIGIPDVVELRASTVLPNQPFGEQEQYDAPIVRNCT